MQPIIASLSGLLPFALYFGTSLLLLVLFKYLYTLVTPRDMAARNSSSREDSTPITQDTSGFVPHVILDG